MRRNHLIKLTIAIITVLFVFPIFFINNVNASATSKQRIYDYAGLLNQNEIDQLEAIAEEYSIKRETDFIFLTTKNEEKQDVKKIMGDFYDEQGLGYDKNHGNTAILTVDMYNREIQLGGFYKAETYLDDHRLDLIREKITPDMSAGNYAKAFESFIKTADEYMDIRPGVDPNNILFQFWFQLAASVGLGGIVVLIMAYNSGGKVTINNKTYENLETSKVLQRKDQYIRTTTTKRKKPQSNSGGGSGGGGGGRTGGGHSFSGSRGKF